MEENFIVQFFTERRWAGEAGHSQGLCNERQTEVQQALEELVSRTSCTAGQYLVPFLRGPQVTSTTVQWCS